MNIQQNNVSHIPKHKILNYIALSQFLEIVDLVERNKTLEIDDLVSISALLLLLRITWPIWIWSAL